MVYIVIALGLLVIEILVWWLTHETTHTADDLLARVGTRVERHLSRGAIQEKSAMAREKTHRFLSWFTSRTFRDVVRKFVLRPGEIINTAWLTYILFAQTFGAYFKFLFSIQTSCHQGRINRATVWQASGQKAEAS